MSAWLQTSFMSKFWFNQLGPKWFEQQSFE